MDYELHITRAILALLVAGLLGLIKMVLHQKSEMSAMRVEMDFLTHSVVGTEQIRSIVKDELSPVVKLLDSTLDMIHTVQTQLGHRRESD